MKSILIITPYFGKWPVWHDAYLLSISKNETINWLFVTDCIIPDNKPINTLFIQSSMIDFYNRINNVIGVDIPLFARKICDMRVAYGEIFKDEISDYDFWGYSDIDVIWGDIRSFLSEETLEYYDIISSRKYNASGHFTIFKNNEQLNSLYKTIPGYKEMFENERLQRIEEEVLTAHLDQILNNPSINNLKVKWDKILCNHERGIDSHQEYHLDKWQWNNGKMIDVQMDVEVMYLHFINWKIRMKYCELAYNDNPIQFYISCNGIHYKQHSKLEHFVNNIKNLVNGYWVQEKRRYRKLKLNILKKRVKRKLT